MTVALDLVLIYGILPLVLIQKKSFFGLDLRWNEIFSSLIAGYKDDVEKYALKTKEQGII